MIIAAGTGFMIIFLDSSELQPGTHEWKLDKVPLEMYGIVKRIKTTKTAADDSFCLFV